MNSSRHPPPADGPFDNNRPDASRGTSRGAAAAAAAAAADVAAANSLTAALIDRWQQLARSATADSFQDDLRELLILARRLLTADAVAMYRQSAAVWTQFPSLAPLPDPAPSLPPPPRSSTGRPAAGNMLSEHMFSNLPMVDGRHDLEQLVAQAADQPQRVAVVGPWRAISAWPSPPWVLVARPPVGGQLSHRSLAAAAAVLGLLVSTRSDQAAASARGDDLQQLLEWSMQWSAIESTEELLESIAAAATQLLAAERASIFLWDKRRGKLIGRPALGVEGGRLEVDADAGLVGAVLRSGQPQVWTAGADQESQVNRRVDRQLRFVTRSLVAVRLENTSGRPVGVFEVINKLPLAERPDGERPAFDDRDIRRLSELAKHAEPVLRSVEIRQRLTRTRDRLLDDVAANHRILGQTAEISRLRETIARVAPTDLAVLVLGENGTGKEVVARSLHLHSQRRDQPFVAVNCAALVESLLESELFGHERGAFTDAHQSRPGKFELASGGTLFLDEIGDMSPGGQAKLLRVLEEKVIVRVGGSTPIAVDVRVIAATNQSLPQRVAQNRFREDLLFRLNVVSLQLPPLRERGDDILLLANHFLSDFAQHIGRPQPALSADAAAALLRHRWPGNIRELRNVMERVCYLTQQPQIHAADLGLDRQLVSPVLSGPQPAGGGQVAGDAAAAPASQAGTNAGSGAGGGDGFDDHAGSLADATRAFQIRRIEASLAATGGNLTVAAARLGLHRSNLYRKMRQLGMSIAAADAAADDFPIQEPD